MPFYFSHFISRLLSSTLLFDDHNPRVSSHFLFILLIFLIILPQLTPFRRANDVTAEYGESLSHIVQQVVKPLQVIIDGELQVWDSVANRFEDFGKMKTLAKAVGDNPANADMADGRNFFCMTLSVLSLLFVFIFFIYLYSNTSIHSIRCCF